MAYAYAGQLMFFMGYRCKSPVFIIGTGRCGTTLLANILSSHSKLIGFPGEANELWHPKSYPFSKRTIDTPAIVQNPQKFTDISIDNWPDDHVQYIQKIFLGCHILSGINKILFVKSSMISFMLPCLRALFPESKFLHIYRNGPSVVASIVKKEWEKQGRYFTSKEAFKFCCAKYWNDCMLQIEKQKNELYLEGKSDFLEFSYEKLCEKPRETLGVIADFLLVDSCKFNFDIGKITSQNYKVGSYGEDEKWVTLMQVMSPAMRLKGYIQ